MGFAAEVVNDVFQSNSAKLLQACMHANKRLTKCALFFSLYILNVLCLSSALLVSQAGRWGLAPGLCLGLLGAVCWGSALTPSWHLCCGVPDGTAPAAR